MLQNLDLHKPKTSFPSLPTQTQSLSLKEELEANFEAAKRLRESMEHDDLAPANQKAQVMNTITTILTQQIRLEEDLHNIEMFKKTEQALIAAVKTLPEEAQDIFFELYEQRLP